MKARYLLNVLIMAILAITDAAWSPAASQNGASGEQKLLSVFVTDFGINNWSPEQKMFKDFDKTKAGSIVPNLPKEGQILIPMPEIKDLPRNAPDWATLKLNMAEGIIKRIKEGNLSTYEVRITQNIDAFGYMNPLRQSDVKNFGRAAYEALGLVKSYFERKDTNVYMPAVVGSNGGFMLTETLPKLKYNPIYSAILIDVRAHVIPTMETYKVLGGRLTGINTAGDIPALPNMVANHDSMKALKKALPDMHIFWVDPKGLDIVVNNHLASMHKDRTLLAKEFDGHGYTTPTKMTGWELIGRALDLQRPPMDYTKSSPPAPGGVWLRPTLRIRKVER